jgi:NAD/NADP transhydrogenase alpha subunit
VGLVANVCYFTRPSAVDSLSKPAAAAKGIVLVGRVYETPAYTPRRSPEVGGGHPAVLCMAFGVVAEIMSAAAAYRMLISG